VNKKQYAHILLFLIANYCLAQAPVIQWQQSYGGSGNDYANDIKPTPDGGYIMVGSSTSSNGNATSNQGGADFWVVKLNAAGTMQWQKSLGGTANDIARSVSNTTDGGYIVAGGTGSNNGNVSGNHGGLNDYWVVKLDALGNIQWQKTYGGSNSEEAEVIQTTGDGGYIIAGASNSNNGDVSGNHGGYDSWIVKIDATGNLLWQKSLGGNYTDEAEAFITTTDGGFIMAALSNSNDGDVIGNQGSMDYWIVKLDANGNQQWQQSYGGSSGDEPTCIQNTADGGYIVGGITSSNNGNVTGNNGLYDYWVIKLNSNGNLQWQTTLGGSSLDLAYGIQPTPDGGYIVAGASGSNNGNVTGNHGGYDGWVAKLNANGILQWQKSIGSNASDGMAALLNANDNGYILVGYNSAANGDVTTNLGGADCWVVKLYRDALNNVTFKNKTITICQNPTSDVLQWQTSGSSPITKIKIIDSNGKTVLEQYNNTNAISIAMLANGMYILEGYAENEKLTAKFIKK
jgi:hypothetical protein